MSQKKQRELSLSIKRARNLALYKMKVIFLENVRKIGSIGEIIDVKRGFARNFLISKKKALFASKENIKEVEKNKTRIKQKRSGQKKEAKLIHDKIKNKHYEIKKIKYGK